MPARQFVGACQPIVTRVPDFAIMENPYIPAPHNGLKNTSLSIIINRLAIDFRLPHPHTVAVQSGLSPLMHHHRSLARLVALFPILSLITVLWWSMPTTAAPLEKVVLQLKWRHQFQFAGYYAAIEKGYYRDAGLEVELRERKTGTAPTEMLLNGEAQFAIADSTVVLRRLNGKPLVVLAAIFQHSPLAIISLADKGLVSPLELVGKRIMAQRNIDDAVLTAMFTEFRITEDQYQPMPYSFGDTALLDGEVDAMSAYITDQPFLYRQLGHTLNIISPSNYGIDFYGDMLIVEESYLKRHTDRVMAFRRATLKGWDYALKHPQEVIAWLRSRYPSNKSTAHLTYEAEMLAKMIQPDLIELGYINAKRFKRIADIYRQIGMAPAKEQLSGLSYEEHLPKPFTLAKQLNLLLAVLAIACLWLVIMWGLNRRLKSAVALRTRELAKANHRLKRNIQTLNRYVISSTTDRRGVLTDVSQAFCKLAGVHRELLLGKPHPMFRPEIMPGVDIVAVHRQLMRHGRWSGEQRGYTQDGEVFWLDIRIERVVNEEQHHLGYTGVAIDITDKKRIEHLSVTDALTGLANRLKLNDFCQQSLAQAKRARRELTVVLLDIDHFKQVNDKHGHHNGDAVLIALAELLSQRIRSADLLGRWGGEEFMLVCIDTDLEGAGILAEQCRQAIVDHEFPVAKHQTCSFGLAQWDGNESYEELFARADKALYEAKATGRNRVVCLEAVA